MLASPKQILRKALTLTASALLRPAYSGIGAIVCLHRVAETLPGPRIPENTALEITPAALTAILEDSLARRLHIVSPDEAHQILRAGGSRRKFLAFTFDDGYLDNLTLALPVFKKFDLPFAVNITTSFVGNDAKLWWYRLEAALHHNTALELAGPEAIRLPTATASQKRAAFGVVSDLVRKLPPVQREEFLSRFFEQNPAPPQARRLMMNWDEVKQLAAEPLVTIGAHSVNHYDFNRLTDAELLFELRESRAILEAQTGRTVAHFAYPFGGRNAVGPREFALTKTCGYKTAVTTRSANLFPAHADWLECLPRLTVSGNYPAPDRFRLLQSGALAAFQNNFRRVITD